VGHGGALAALDWGSEGAKAASDGGQWERRRSGEEMSSGKEHGGKEVRQHIHKIAE
jgi:hypothetical protein